MRKALNENPLVQIAFIGLLAVVVGFLLLTRVMNGNSGSGSPPTATTSDVATAVAEPAASATAAPDADASAATTAPEAQPEVAAGTGFEPGPGLPSSVVDAYDDGKTVALLIVRTRGIDDRALTLTSAALAARPEVELFVLPARRIARYSRIASGVDVNRVPAFVVLAPKRLSDGGLPRATVSYGFRGPASVLQAIEDAEYKGKTDLPYYPR
jgi:hypothetical protein